MKRLVLPESPDLVKIRTRDLEEALMDCLYEIEDVAANPVTVWLALVLDMELRLRNPRRKPRVIVSRGS